MDCAVPGPNGLKCKLEAGHVESPHEADGVTWTVTLDEVLRTATNDTSGFKTVHALVHHTGFGAIYVTIKGCKFRVVGNTLEYIEGTYR